MNKFSKITSIAAAAAIAAASFSLAACGDNTVKPHEHQWDWERTETEHYATCMVKGCKETIHGNHTGEDGEDVTWVCDECAEFKALALGFVSGGDSAHADFAVEANKWFPEQAKKFGFIYDFTTDLGAANAENLQNYDVAIFLNNRPSGESLRPFKEFMEGGGGCIAFHASGFAMWSAPPSEWDDWYQNTLMRSDVYGERPRVGLDVANGTTYWNTWNPTSEPLKVETHDHYATENLDCNEFVSAPCEWYEWRNDLFADDGTTVLLSLNPTPENPAGDDIRKDNPAKNEYYEHQIWRDGHHPIAWANNEYNFVYMNWGHNLQSYNIPTGSPVGESETFSCIEQCQFTLDALFGVAGRSYVNVDYAASLEAA